MLRLLFKPVRDSSFTRTVLKSAWLLFGCVTCGYYGTPTIMAWAGVDQSDPNNVGFMGALIGFVGLSIAEGILKGVDGFNIGNVLRFFIKSDGGVK